MRRNVLYVYCLLIPSLVFTQTELSNVWITGYEGELGIDTTFGINVFDFSDSSIEPYRGNIKGISFGSNSSSICDDDGKLLLFTDGCFIFNGEHQLIEEGDQINEGEFRDRCVKTRSYLAGNASTIFLPVPLNDSAYYLIHQRIDEISPESIASLLYSKIEISGNNGIDQVTELNNLISNNEVLLGEMAAVKHENGEDWWVIAPNDASNTYSVILADKNGVRKSHQQKIGLPINSIGMGTGQCKFSPDGKKFARWTSTQQLLIADFDRKRGIFSNDDQLEVVDTIVRGGVEFSPNSRFLYVSTSDKLFQLDFEESDLLASKVLVSRWDGYQDFVRTFFRRLQITPDCRIFISMPGSHRYWHIIQNPNEKGVNCNVVQRGLSHKTWTFNTMPYFPNYNLGIFDGYPCDSTKLSVSSSEIMTLPNQSLVYPNPTKGKVRINLPPYLKDLSLKVFSLTGQPLFSSKISTEKEIDLSGLANGIYFFKISNNNKYWSGKLIITN